MEKPSKDELITASVICFDLAKCVESEKKEDAGILKKAMNILHNNAE